MSVVRLAVAALGVAVIAVVIDRRLFQRRRYDAWKEENEKKIVELEQKSAALHNKLNNLYGQLMTLGIKLPGGTK